MQPHDFRYTLIIRENEYVLKHSPLGWDENTIQWARSSVYHGMVRTFSLPLKFVEQGATLLRREFFRNGIESEVTLRIEMLNRFNWAYDVLYTGMIDFTTYDDDITGVEVNIADMGLESKIKAFEKVKYEIEPKDVIDVEVVGEIGSGSANWLVQSTYSKSYFATPYFSLDLFSINEETIELRTGFSEIDQDLNVLLSKDSWFLKAKSGGLNDVVISIKLDMDYIRKTTAIEGANNIMITLYGSQGDRSIWSKSFYNKFESDEFSVKEDVYLSLYSNEKLFLVFSTDNWLPSIKKDSSFVKMIYAVEGTVANTKALRPFTLFESLIHKMVGSKIPVESFLLKEWEQLTIASGDMLREIDGAGIKTTFADFFQSIDAVLCAGFGIENGVPRIERRDYWYKKNLQAVKIGGVKDFHLSVAQNYIFNSIKAGYPDNDYEAESGREEFNSEQEYRLDITRIEKSQDMRSKYRADQYGIEGMKRQSDIANLTGEDKKGDNSVFFLYVRPTPEGGVYKLENHTDFYSVKGVSGFTSKFNLRISPKQNLLRHVEWIKSFYPDGIIRFESAEKNVNLVTIDLNANTVGEKDNIDMSDYKGKTFLPYIAEFSAPLDKSVSFVMDALATGFIQFEYLNKQFMGFILETSIDASRNSVQEYKLLLTPDNDILDLIH